VVTAAGPSRRKFQKFHQPDEFLKLLRRHFKRVEIAQLEANDSALVGVCTSLRPIAPRTLERALRFEFDLPIDGEPLGRADRAAGVFEKWMGRR
jgi:hypothetical protein